VGNRGFTTPQRTLTHDGSLVFWLAALADESAPGLDTANGRAERRILAYDFASVPRQRRLVVRRRNVRTCAAATLPAFLKKNSSNKGTMVLAARPSILMTALRALGFPVARGQQSLAPLCSAVPRPQPVIGSDSMHLRKRVPFASLFSAALAVALALFAWPCVAHHSSAMFDVKGSLNLDGTVKFFQWTNPHCWIQVLVPGSGAVTEWSVEMGAPSQLYRNGWRPGTLKSGDHVTLVIHPMKDVTKGGQFVSGIGPSGAPFGSAVPEPRS
jgi:hypothetical protein